jgi:hypothetical protein
MLRRDTSVATRALALLVVAGFVLHELRYTSWLGGADAQSGVHEYGNLRTMLGPLLSVLTTVGCASLMLFAARARSSLVRMRNLWLIASGGLLAIYADQELAQGVLDAHHHPFGLHSLFEHGGWIVVPLALVLGGIVAIAVGVVRELERRWGWTAFEFVWPAVARFIDTASVALVRSQPLADNLAGRSPPSFVV